VDGVDCTRKLRGEEVWCSRKVERGGGLMCQKGWEGRRSDIPERLTGEEVWCSRKVQGGGGLMYQKGREGRRSDVPERLREEEVWCTRKVERGGGLMCQKGWEGRRSDVPERLEGRMSDVPERLRNSAAVPSFENYWRLSAVVKGNICRIFVQSVEWFALFCQGHNSVLDCALRIVTNAEMHHFKTCFL
jgi:hypothetical protein